MASRLYIVSAYRPELMDELVLNVGLSEDTQVFVDRRQGERRVDPRASVPKIHERRRPSINDRRRSSVDAALREHGLAVVELRDVPVVR